MPIYQHSKEPVADRKLEAAKRELEDAVTPEVHLEEEEAEKVSEVSEVRDGCLEGVDERRGEFRGEGGELRGEGRGWKRFALGKEGGVGRQQCRG